MKIYFNLFLIFVSYIGLAQEIKLGLPLGHTKEVFKSSFSNDENLAFTISHDLSLKMWDLKTNKLLYTINDHNTEIIDANFSSDNKFIVVGSKEKLSIYNSETGELVWDIKDGGQGLTEISFSNNDKFIVGKYNNGEIKVWETKLKVLRWFSRDEGNFLTAISDNAQTVALIKNDTIVLKDFGNQLPPKKFIGQTGKINSLEFSMDGKFLLTYSHEDENIKVWNVQEGQLVTLFPAHHGEEWFYKATFSERNNYLLYYTRNVLQIWDLKNPGTTISKEFDRISEVKLSPKENYFFVSAEVNGSKYLKKMIFDLKSGELLKDFTQDNKNTFSMAFSPSEELIMLNMWQESQIVNTKTGNSLYTLKGFSNEIKSIKFANKSLDLVLQHDFFELLSMDTGKKSPRQVVHKNYDGARHLSIIHQGNLNRFIWILDAEPNIKDINRRGHTLLGKIQAEGIQINNILFCRDTDYFLSDYNNLIKIWDTKNAEEVKTLTGHSGEIKSLQQSRDGRFILSSSSDSTAILWNYKSGRPIRSFKDQSGPLQNAFFSQDESLVVTASMNGTVKVWDTEVGKLEFSTSNLSKRIYAADISANNEILLTIDGTHRYDGNGISLWDIKTGKKKDNLITHNAFIYDTKFSPNSEYLLTGSVDKTAKLWNIENGRLEFTLDEHSAAVQSVDFSHNSEFMATGSDDGSIIIWDVNNGEPLIRRFIFENNPSKWLHLHSSGLFDASYEAMELMYYTYGTEVIEFSQLKGLYWEPGLWQKVISRQELRKVPSKEELKKYLPPKIIYPKELKENNSNIPVTITKRGGGLGLIRVYINGVEISHDLNEQVDSTLTTQVLILTLDKRNDLPNGENNIEILAETSNGKITSGRGGIAIKNNKNLDDPSFFGVTIGVGDYPIDNNQDMNLQFAEKDVDAMEKALKLATPPLFKNRNFYQLSTQSNDIDSIPNKTNIRKVFDEIADKAGPNDLIWIHFSGHGKAILKDAETDDKDIHLLLNDWVNVDLNALSSKPLITERSISGEELKEILRKIKANKRVIILDACEAGSFYKAKSGNNTLVKSLDRLRQASGAAIIMGSQENQSSYETSNYQMGLLTYSLLEGMKNTPVESPINSLAILQHAEARVQDLAAELGVKQQPKIIGTANFPFGSLDDEALSNFPSLREKPLIADIWVSSKNSIDDPLNLKSSIIKAIKNYDDGNKSSFSYRNIDVSNNSYYTLICEYLIDEDKEVYVLIQLFNKTNRFSETIKLGDTNNMNGIIEVLERMLKD